MAQVIRSKAPDWGLLGQVLAVSTAIVGGYVTLEREIATLQAQVESLERNARGMETYVMDLYRQPR